MAGRRSGGRPSWIAGVLLSWLARRAGDDRVRGFTANEDLFKVLLVASRMSPGGSTASVLLLFNYYRCRERGSSFQPKI